MSTDRRRLEGMLAVERPHTADRFTPVEGMRAVETQSRPRTENARTPGISLTMAGVSDRRDRSDRRPMTAKIAAPCKVFAIDAQRNPGGKENRRCFHGVIHPERGGTAIAGQGITGCQDFQITHQHTHERRWEMNTKWVLSLLLTSGMASLSGCGTSPVERGVTGAGIGAAAGAIGGAVVGAPGTGAAVGAAVGGAAGALTEPDDVDLGDPVWKKKNR
jgi:hypothetical protein